MMTKRIATFRADGRQLLKDNTAREAWASQNVRCNCGSYGDRSESISGTCNDMPAEWLGCTNCTGQALGRPLIYRLPSQMGVFAVLLLLIGALPVHADIYRWDNGEVIPGTEGIEPGPGLDLFGSDLSFANLRSFDLTGLRVTRLTDADLSGANLTNARLYSVNMQRANLTGANLQGANMDNADLEGFRDTNFTDANLSGAQMRRATDKWFSKEQLYSTANYKVKDMRGMSFEASQLYDWDLRGQDLTGANLLCSLYGAVINGARLPVLIDLYRIYQTASYQNHDLTGIDFSLKTLAGADLTGQDLRGATLFDVTDANLSGANLTGLSFERVIVGNTIFAGAVGYVPRGFTRTPGDSNGDGLFDSSDLVSVFAIGEYDDTEFGNSTFEDGDWNADGDFDSGDLVTAFSAGAFEPQVVAAAVAVPEPSTLTAIVLFVLGMLLKGRR